jgi:hypothetical protein
LCDDRPRVTAYGRTNARTVHGDRDRDCGLGHRLRNDFFRI